MLIKLFRNESKKFCSYFRAILQYFLKVFEIIEFRSSLVFATLEIFSKFNWTLFSVGDPMFYTDRDWLID